LDAEQALRARRIDGLLRKACATVDVIGLRGRDCGYAGYSLREGTAIEDELLAGLFSARITKIGLLNIHEKHASMAFLVQSVGACNFRTIRTLKDLIQMRR
jgi:hypothetical protein